jgi:hypothetical protein
MGHRSMHQHKSRHRQHANKPPNLLQGSRVIKSAVLPIAPQVGLPSSLETVSVATSQEKATSPEVA